MISPVVTVLLLFFLGSTGLFLFRHNVIVVLMGLELMLFAANLLLIFSSVQLDDLIGQLFGLLVLAVAAAESAIGLAILVVYYRLRGSISLDYISALKGLFKNGAFSFATSSLGSVFVSFLWPLARLLGS